MKKPIILKLNLEAGIAAPNPYISSLLGNYGINILSFCKEYNNKTKLFKGLRIPVTIYFFDSKLSFKLHLPPLSFLISFFSVNKNIKLKKIIEIVNLKHKEFFYINRRKYLSMLKGTLKSMKINIIK